MKKIIFGILFFLPSAAWATCNSPCVATASCNMTGGGACTTSSINTTGANFVVVGISTIDTTGLDACGLTVSDNKSNGNATLLTIHNQSAAQLDSIIGYWTNPTVGSGHTWTANQTSSCFETIIVAAFSGMATVSPAEGGSDHGTNTASGTSLTPGTFTPSQNCDVTIAHLALSTGATSQSVTITGGFSIINQIDFNSSNWFGGTLAYIKQSGMAAVNPTFSWTGSAPGATSIASFKSSSTSCAIASGKGQLTTVNVGK